MFWVEPVYMYLVDSCYNEVLLVAAHEVAVRAVFHTRGWVELLVDCIHLSHSLLQHSLLCDYVLNSTFTVSSEILIKQNLKQNVS